MIALGSQLENFSEQKKWIRSNRNSKSESSISSSELNVNHSAEFRSDLLRFYDGRCTGPPDTDICGRSFGDLVAEGIDHVPVFVWIEDVDYPAWLIDSVCFG